MGLFDTFKKTNNLSACDFGRDLTSEAAIVLNTLKFTKDSPFLLTIKEDQGILEGLTYSHLNNPQLIILGKQNPDLYLTIIGSHLLGVGVYVAACQKKFGKSANEFGQNEMFEIRDAFNSMDVYELGLKMLEVDVNSNQKKAIDNAIVLIKDAAKKLYPNLKSEEEYLKEYMRVFYYVGVTLAAAYKKM